MAKGSFSATATSSEIVAANEYREGVTLQFQSGDPVSYAFGEDAVFNEGLKATAAGDTVKVTGHLAREAINAICDTGETASGGYQEF